MPRPVLAAMVMLEVLAGHICAQRLHVDLADQADYTDGPTVAIPSRSEVDIPIPASLRFFGFYGVMLGGEESFAFSNFVFDWPANINTTILNRDAGPAL